MHNLPKQTINRKPLQQAGTVHLSDNQQKDASLENATKPVIYKANHVKFTNQNNVHISVGNVCTRCRYL